MFRNLKAGENVVISVVPDKEVEVGEILDVSKRLLVVKSKTPHPPRWREFCRDTGFNVKGEEFGKLLRADDLAIKEVLVKCPYPHCGATQKNFFMVGEYFAGQKNFNCFYCKKPLTLHVDGRVIMKEVSVKCPLCKASHTISFTDTEFSQGGKNVRCCEGKKVLWVYTDGCVKSVTRD